MLFNKDVIIIIIIIIIIKDVIIKDERRWFWADVIFMRHSQ